MSTTKTVIPIEERLKSKEFVDQLREHPIIKNKVERAKKSLAEIKANERLKADQQ